MTFRLSHLALLLAITIVAATFGGVASTWWVAGKEFRDVLDDDLENQSKLLAELIATGSFRLSAGALQGLLEDVFESDDEDTLWVTVYDLRSGRHVSNLPHDLPLELRDDGSINRRYAGHGWHGYQEREKDVVVQLLRREDRYREVQQDILEDIVTPALLGSSISLLLLATLIALFLWPVTRLSRQLESRNADSLAPLTVKTPAREIQVLRDSLNSLMRGVDAVLTRERRFASDVAHELRTPLTTLKLELASPEPDLPALKSEVDRLSRLVEQLLTLARLEQGQCRQHFSEVELSELYTGVIKRFEARFDATGMTLHSRISRAAVIGDATLLEILLQNLLQNVLNHCPAGTRADLFLESMDGSVRLRVSDTGAGIPEESRRRMEQGFTRLDSKSEGLGLGLAICHRIAEVHGASMHFLARDDGTSGLVVEVVFAT